MSNTTTDGRADYEAIRRDIAALSSQLADLVGHVRSAAGAQARQGYADLTARGDRVIEVASGHVRSRPLSSLLVALAVGYLASCLFRR